jgi:hypothetical protein
MTIFCGDPHDQPCFYKRLVWNKSLNNELTGIKQLHLPSGSYRHTPPSLSQHGQPKYILPASTTVPDMVTTKDSTAEEKRKASDEIAKINAAYEALAGKTGRSSTGSSTSGNSKDIRIAAGHHHIDAPVPPPLRPLQTGEIIALYSCRR